MPTLEGKHAQTRAECVPTLPYLCRQCTASTLSIVVQYAIAIENICPIFTKLFSLTTSYSSVAPTMSATSSRLTLDFELSRGSLRRTRPYSSPHSPQSPRSPVRDLFDGRVDRDYFGQKDDVSDMKVSASYSWISQSLRSLTCHV